MVTGSHHLKTGKDVGTQKVWGFVIEDYAEFFGMSVEAARKAIQRGSFDPGDLRSIMGFALKRHGPEEEIPQLSVEPKKLPE